MSSDRHSSKLRSALDAVQVPGANPEFKAQLARRFIAGELEGAGEEDGGGPCEVHLDSWDVLGADPEFRASLRAEFLSGELAAQPQAPVLVMSRYALAIVAAAAALLFWFAPWTSSEAGHWRAVGFDLAAASPAVQIDGRSVLFADSAALDSAMSQGCRLETASEALVLLQVEEGVLLEVAETTQVEIARVVGADDSLELRFTVESGGLRVTMRPEFTGSLHVITPDADIELAGRTLGVDVVDSGTCLCILEGEASMSAIDGGGELRVLSNSTGFVGRGGGEVVLMEGEVHHGEQLAAVRVRGELFLY